MTIAFTIHKTEIFFYPALTKTAFKIKKKRQTNHKTKQQKKTPKKTKNKQLSILKTTVDAGHTGHRLILELKTDIF